MSLLRYHLKGVSMRNKEVDYKRIVEDFDEYISDKEVYDDLLDMSPHNIMRIIKEVWEEIKGGF